MPSRFWPVNLCIAYRVATGIHVAVVVKQIRRIGDDCIWQDELAELWVVVAGAIVHQAGEALVGQCEVISRQSTSNLALK